VSIGAGTSIHGSTVRDTIIGTGARLEGCAITRGMIGDHAMLDGVTGKVTIGDHTEIRRA
jgi:glucose-1-phosphate thymidylyltransferase